MFTLRLQSHSWVTVAVAIGSFLTPETDYQKHYESAHINIRDSITHKSAPVDIFTNYVATQSVVYIISGYVCYDCNRYRLKLLISPHKREPGLDARSQATLPWQVYKIIIDIIIDCSRQPNELADTLVRYTQLVNWSLVDVKRKFNGKGHRIYSV